MLLLLLVNCMLPMLPADMLLLAPWQVAAAAAQGSASKAAVPSLLQAALLT
jgi:hypothetical protein